jgi:hypothetical protein
MGQGRIDRVNERRFGAAPGNNPPHPPLRRKAGYKDLKNGIKK